MAIYRVNKTGNYTVMSNVHLRDTHLSWKAKGLLSYLLSLPDDWKIHQSELVERAPEGIAAVRSGVKELVDAGFMETKQLRDDNGKFDGIEYQVYEIPKKTQPAVQFHESGKPDIRKTDIGKSNTTKYYNKLNTNKLNTNNMSSSTIKEVVEYLNEKAGRDFSPKGSTTMKLINARIKEGYTLEDFKKVIDIKVKDWGKVERGKKDMRKYLRPQTLFNKTKFENYMQEVLLSTDTDDEFFDSLGGKKL